MGSKKQPDPPNSGDFSSNGAQQPLNQRSAFLPSKAVSLQRVPTVNRAPLHGGHQIVNQNQQQTAQSSAPFLTTPQQNTRLSQQPFTISIPLSRVYGAQNPSSNQQQNTVQNPFVRLQNSSVNRSASSHANLNRQTTQNMPAFMQVTSKNPNQQSSPLRATSSSVGKKPLVQQISVLQVPLSNVTAGRLNQSLISSNSSTGSPVKKASVFNDGKSSTKKNRSPTRSNFADESFKNSLTVSYDDLNQLEIKNANEIEIDKKASNEIQYFSKLKTDADFAADADWMGHFKLHKMDQDWVIFCKTNDSFEPYKHITISKDRKFELNKNAICYLEGKRNVKIVFKMFYRAQEVFNKYEELMKVKNNATPQFVKKPQNSSTGSMPPPATPNKPIKPIKTNNRSPLELMTANDFELPEELNYAQKIQIAKNNTYDNDFNSNELKLLIEGYEKAKENSTVFVREDGDEQMMMCESDLFYLLNQSHDSFDSNWIRSSTINRFLRHLSSQTVLVHSVHESNQILNREFALQIVIDKAKFKKIIVAVNYRNYHYYMIGIYFHSKEYAVVTCVDSSQLLKVEEGFTDADLDKLVPSRLEHKRFCDLMKSIDKNTKYDAIYDVVYPKQDDDIQCGVFLCVNAQNFALNQEFEIRPNDLFSLRQQLCIQSMRSVDDTNFRPLHRTQHLSVYLKNESNDLSIVSLDNLDKYVGQHVNTVAVIVSIIGSENENDDSDEDSESDEDSNEEDSEDEQGDFSTKELIVVDKSFNQVTVKLMGKHANNLLSKEKQAVVFENALVQEDNGQIVLLVDDTSIIHSTSSQLINDLQVWFDSATDLDAIINKCEEYMDTQAPVQEEAIDLDESSDLNEASDKNRTDFSGELDRTDSSGDKYNFDFKKSADRKAADQIIKERGKEARKAFESGVGLPIKENTRIIEAGVYTIGYNDALGFPDYTLQDLTNYTPTGYRKHIAFRVDKGNHVGNKDQYSKRCNAYAYNGAYDRGHVACAADNSNDAIDFRSTFIYSNVFPMHESLNRKAWYLLEKYIRRTVSKEGTYVCTGVFVDDTEETRYLNDGTTVVPGYCFKSVLIKTGNGYLARSWLLPNKNVKFRDLHTYVTNIGTIEKLANIKLFPNIELDCIEEMSIEHFVDDALTKTLIQEIVEKWYRKHSEDFLDADATLRQFQLLSLVDRRCCICNTSEHSGGHWRGTAETPKRWLCYGDYKRARRLEFRNQKDFTTENIEKVRQDYLKDPEPLTVERPTENTRCCICDATEHGGKQWHGTAETPKTWLCYDDLKRARRVVGFRKQKNFTTENVEKVRQDYLKDPESGPRFKKSTENTRCCICDATEHGGKQWHGTHETPKRWLCKDDYNRARRMVRSNSIADLTTENVEKVRQDYLKDPEPLTVERSTENTRCCICDATEHGSDRWRGTNETPKTWLCYGDYKRARRLGFGEKGQLTTENVEKVRQDYLKEQARQRQKTLV